jgi:hypothetical protein
LQCISQKLKDPKLVSEWRKELDSPLVGTESVAVWLLSWALHQLPHSRAVFFSADHGHIRDMARGVGPLLADPVRFSIFESLYRKLSP